MHFHPKEFLSICLKLRTCFRDVWNRDELNKMVFQTGPTWRRNQVIPVISWLTKMQLHLSTLFTLWKWYALWYVIVHGKERHQLIQSDKASTDLRFISLWQTEITNGRIKTYLTCQNKNASFYHLRKQWHICITLIV